MSIPKERICNLSEVVFQAKPVCSLDPWYKKYVRTLPCLHSPISCTTTPTRLRKSCNNCFFTWRQPPLSKHLVWQHWHPCHSLNHVNDCSLFEIGQHSNGAHGQRCQFSATLPKLQSDDSQKRRILKWISDRLLGPAVHACHLCVRQGPQSTKKEPRRVRNVPG